MIKDNDIRRAINTLTTEFESMEALNYDINQELGELTKENAKLRFDLEDLKTKIKHLESALIEAHFTGSK